MRCATRWLYEAPGSNNCSVLEHLEILDAIQARDFAKAEQLMDDHLVGCERQLRLDEDPAPTVDLAMALGAQPNFPVGSGRRGAPRLVSSMPVKRSKARARTEAAGR